MAVKFKEGRSYRVTHPGGYWAGIVKVLAVNGDNPRVVVTKFLKSNKHVEEFFKDFGASGCELNVEEGNDWNQKEINMTLENK